MFGRRVRSDAPPPAAAAVPLSQMAIVANQPVLPAPPSQDGIHGQAGWKPMPGAQNPSQQIGMFAGSMLNQFPALTPGLQLLNGREGMQTNYYTPTAFPVYLGGLSQTTTPNNLPGAQLHGSQFSGPIGPMTASAMQANVVAAQVRQSGAAAMSWAKALAPTYDGGT